MASEPLAVDISRPDTIDGRRRVDIEHGSRHVDAGFDLPVDAADKIKEDMAERLDVDKDIFDDVNAFQNNDWN